MLVSEARTNFGLVKKDISDVGTDTFISWCDIINTYLYRNVKSVDPERFIAESTISVTSATNTYALPADFRDMQEMGTGIYLVDSSTNRTTSAKLARTGVGSESVGFFIKGTNIIFTPFPSASKSYTLRYIPTLTELTTVSQSFVSLITFEYKDYINKALDTLYTIWDEDPNAESMADQRFVRVMDDLLSKFRKEPASEQLPDFSQIY